LPGQRFAHCCGRHAESAIRQESNLKGRWDNSAVKCKPDYQMTTAAAAALISACALALSFSEFSLMRSEQRAQVWPYIDIAISFGQDGFGVTLANKGTGPALIKSVVVKNEAQTVLS
jgi:hypothetical protein